MVLSGLKGAAWLARAADGVDLALYRAEPEPSRKRTHAPPLLLVHGTFSNRHFFLGAGERGLARYLAAAGYDAWVAELRGHGRSGERGRTAAWHFEDWIRLDAPALLHAVREATGAARVVWIGHSAGGVIGVAYLGLNDGGAPDVAGIVMAGAPAPSRPGAWHVPLSMAGYGITRLLGRFPARALGIGPEDELPGIMSQWLAWNVRGRWVGADGTDYLANARRIDVPVLAIAGGGDIIAPPSSCRRLLEHIGGTDRQLLVCGRRQGFAENYTHDRMIISRHARDEVWPRIRDWLGERFG